ncbi:helix-turn-helix domain-containing protein [Pseudonocardia sp. Cha107L01]|uniref:helix-turn-helix domain-containing protein n=1 Tax=Pseudonocardia sp. Cha107L01 TaxID=3457576 RepID=UPI00403EC195
MGNPRTPGQRLEHAQRDEEIVRLRADGVPPRDIAARYGVTESRVSQIWTKALRSMPARGLDERKAEAEQFYETMISTLVPLLRDPSVPAGTKAKISDSINKWSVSRAELWGLNAAKRREVEIITASTIDKAINELTGEIEAKAQHDQIMAELAELDRRDH